MEPEVIVVFGTILVVLVLGFLVVIPQFVASKGLTQASTFYNTYIDAWVSVIAAVIALLAFVVSVGLYLAHRGPEKAYITGALFLLLVRTFISVLEVASNSNIITKSLSHLLDAGIAFMLFLALRE